MSTIQAARFHTWGELPRVEEVPVPIRGEAEVVVEMQAASLSHLDLSVASGTFGMHPELPYTGGIEGCGLVLEADNIPVGTKVLVRGGGVGLLRDGTWSQLASVPAKAVTVLPQTLAPEVGSTFFQPTSTAYVALNDVARVQPEEKVIVVGAAGAVGAQLVQQALAAGAEVIGVVGTTERFAHVPDGAQTFALDDAEMVRELGKERSATLLVDTIGGAGLAERCAWVRPGGRAVVIGYVAGTSTTLDLPSWLLEDVALLPVNMIRNERRAREVAPQLIEKLVTGELTVEVESFPLSAIDDGLDRLRTGRLRGRGVVAFGDAG